MVRPLHSLALAAALPALALTLGGCGGGGGTSVEPAATTTIATATTTTRAAAAASTRLGKDAYDRRMQRLGRKLAVSVDKMFPLVEAQPGTDVSRESVAKLQRTRAVVTSVATDLSAITPPTPIRAAHQHLLNGLTVFGGELDELIRVLQEGTSKPFGEYAKFDGLRAIARATKEIERKGYAIGS
jgi:hypothetical protein